MDQILTIILISALGPIIGSLIGVIKKPSELFMHNMLSFAAGVMLAVSFLQIIPSGISLSSIWICSLGILLGCFTMYLLDKSLPHIHPCLCSQEHGKNIEKTALFLLIGMFLHNFPEGIAMAAGGVTGISSLLIITIAIAIHDIPEGICTSAPYYYCTKDRLKSFLLSASTAIPTIVGFLLATFVFKGMALWIVGLLIAATAGIMIYISADELIPLSCGNTGGPFSHSTIFSLIIGVIFVILLGSIAS